ncbi:serine protein kinase [Candidatus Epulonipiscium viviparus]|uniref:serine protein kinase n=1 Tax=Candidatus Epulonipiscium viviparus TaxID=420336 RepID=UPI0027380546|nr:serine protein kinase [Candidatus Epulopiscium viviparus]
MDFFKLIEDTRIQTDKSLNITFLEYLYILDKDPTIYKLAHQRLYAQLILNTFENNFFGMENTLTSIKNYFFAAANGGEEARQILYLVGPVGAGKSSLIDSIKQLLENSPAIYHLDGCPMHEEPLHLIPKQIRKHFEDALGLKIQGDLCPKCKYRLIHEFNGKYENFPITSSKFSVSKRLGIGVVPPVDSNNQDTSILIGSVDISKMDLYPEDDPRVFSLNGAFHAANRGIIEFIEVFKNDVEYLYTMLTATQEKLIPSPSRGEMLYFDGIILAHSNEAEWNKFKADPTNEAILDRIVKIEVPYCLILDDEIKIYKKFLEQTNFGVHIAPHTLRVAAQFAILTRLLPSDNVDLFTKLKIYNSEEAGVDISKVAHEGMKGISVRFIMKTFGKAFASCGKCLTPPHFMAVLENEIKDMILPENVKKQYIEFLEVYVKKDYQKSLEEDVVTNFIYSYTEQAQAIFDRYVDIAVASDEIDETAEEFMTEIEMQLNISASAAKGFRQDVAAYVRTQANLGNLIEYTCYPPLKKAIETKLVTSLKQLTRVVTAENSNAGSDRQKYDDMIAKLIEAGYCSTCAKDTLDYLAYFIHRG